MEEGLRLHSPYTCTLHPHLQPEATFSSAFLSISLLAHVHKLAVVQLCANPWISE